MSEEIRTLETQNSAPGWVTVAIVVLAIAALAGVGMAYNASSQTQAVQQAMDGKVKSVQQDFGTQLAQITQHQQQADATNTALQSDLDVVTKRLRLTQGDLKKARAEAADIKTESDQKIADLGTTEKTDIATRATTDDVTAVDGKVTTVRTDLDSTKNDLNMARSELGTLIARNHEDVDTLRRMGERDYVEFTVDGKNKPTKVGNIMVNLRSTNPSKKRFTVALTVNDTQIEKKNLPVNEPVFFQQGTDRRPVELVVNSVDKNKVSGYISMPKAAIATSASN